MDWPEIPSALKPSAWTLESLAMWPAYKEDLALAIEVWERGEADDVTLAHQIFQLASRARRLGEAEKRKQNVEIVRKRACLAVDQRAEEWKVAVKGAMRMADEVEQDLDGNIARKAQTIRIFLQAMVEPSTGDDDATMAARARSKIYLDEMGLIAPWKTRGKFILQVWLAGGPIATCPAEVVRYVKMKMEQLKTWFFLEVG